MPPTIPSGPLMVLVGVAFVAVWNARTRTALRWFLAGAAIWFVAVALKFAWALPLNKPIVGALESHLPHPAYLLLGSLYIGLLTGVFEIGLTFAAGRKWPSLADNANRAVAVGIGAGAIEAILLGVVALAAALLAMSSLPGSAQVREALASTAAVTPLVWLVGPVERVIAVLCHTSSRALVLLGLANRRPCFFWYGFLLMTLLDAVAGFAHLVGAVGKISMWWIEAAVLPFALISVPIVLWCLRQWPSQADAQPGVDAPAARQTEGGE